MSICDTAAYGSWTVGCSIGGGSYTRDKDNSSQLLTLPIPTQIYDLCRFSKPYRVAEKVSFILCTFSSGEGWWKRLTGLKKLTSRVKGAHPLFGSRLTSEAPGVKPSVSSTIPPSSSCSRARKAAAGSSSKAEGCPVSSMSAIFSLGTISLAQLFLFRVSYAHAQNSAPPFSSNGQNGESM